MEYRISDLNVYGNLPEYGIAEDVLGAFAKAGPGMDMERLAAKKLNKGISEILAIADQHRFKGNLWQVFVTWLLVRDENPFSLSWECRRGEEGTLTQFALKDFEMLRTFFFHDFSETEQAFGIKGFSLMADYRGTREFKDTNTTQIGALVSDLAVRLAETGDSEEFCWEVASFYRNHGVGTLGLNKAFQLVAGKGDQEIAFSPVSEFDPVRLTNLWGYEIQKRQLIDNTEAFLKGRPANNVLLYGDSGTGKSTSVKAILNEYHQRGLRMIAVYKHQLQSLPYMIDLLKNRNYSFIIYMDDLSFEDFEIEYKYLKAIIEGGLEPKPENVLIYATSNRRHLIKEIWSDRSDMNDYEVHRSDTMQEKLSLADRFGLTINFSKPLQKEYFEIVLYLAKKNGIALSDEQLLEEARAWGVLHGGLSGRVAQQYINSVLGRS